MGSPAVCKYMFKYTKEAEWKDRLDKLKKNDRIGKVEDEEKVKY